MAAGIAMVVGRRSGNQAVPRRTGWDGEGVKEKRSEEPQSSALPYQPWLIEHLASLT